MKLLSHAAPGQEMPGLLASQGSDVVRLGIDGLGTQQHTVIGWQHGR